MLSNKGRARAALALLALWVLAPLTAPAQQIYRWTDADGNVHFGSLPPVAEQPRAQLTRDDPRAPAASGRGSLQGTWYTLRRDGEYRLQVTDDRFTLEKRHDFGSPAGNGFSFGSFEERGTWRREGSQLIFVHVDSERARRGFGEEQAFTVLELSDSRLSLTTLNEGRHEYVRFTSQGRHDGRIAGRWREKDGELEWSFTDGRFAIQAAGNKGPPIYHGNWRLDGEELALEYVGGSFNNDRLGRVERYAVLDRSAMHLLIKRNQGPAIRLERRTL